MKLGKLSTDISEFEKSLKAHGARVIGGFGSLPYNTISEALAKIKEQDKLGKFRIPDVKLPFVTLDSELSRASRA